MSNILKVSGIYSLQINDLCEYKCKIFYSQPSFETHFLFFIYGLENKKTPDDW